MRFDTRPISLKLFQEYSQVKLKKHGQKLGSDCALSIMKRTPSFNVNPDRGYFKCFGCGKSGDAFAFIMELNGLTFGEALRALAKRANIQLPFRNDAKSEQIRKQRDPTLQCAAVLPLIFFELQLEAVGQGPGVLERPRIQCRYEGKIFA